MVFKCPKANCETEMNKRCDGDYFCDVCDTSYLTFKFVEDDEGDASSNDDVDEPDRKKLRSGKNC